MIKEDSPESKRAYYDQKEIEQQRDFWHGSELSGKICHGEASPVRKNLTTTRQREDYKSFFMKKTTWEVIRISRGWTQRGAISRFAEEIGVTRQYAADIVSCNCGCSSNVIRRIVDLLGIKEGCWCHLFDKTSLRNVDPNHPIFNQMKYNGEIPYRQYSPAGSARAQDYNVEKSHQLNYFDEPAK